MPSDQSPAMGARYVAFIVGSLAILMINMLVMSMLYPQAQKHRPGEQVAADKAMQPSKAAAAGAGAKAEPRAEAKSAVTEKHDISPLKAPAEAAVPAQWVTLGSADPDDPYRMLVTLTNRGAAVQWIELSSRRFRDLEDGSGYLGHVAVEPTGREDGCEVQVVGLGTPAAKAGLKRGDLITALGGEKVRSYYDLQRCLAKTKPKQTVSLTVNREGKELKLTATLTLHPLEVIQPEGADPLSFLLTLHQIDQWNLERLRAKELEEQKQRNGDQKGGARFKRRPDIGQELDGLNLRTGTWQVVRSTPTEAVFRRRLLKWGLELTKTYRLVRVSEAAMKDPFQPAYHLSFDIQVRNIGKRARRVAYQLDGPTGLPIEGYWYASKISRTWGASGLRDVVVALEGDSPKMISAVRIADDDLGTVWKEPRIQYVGIDAQYFSAVLIPQPKSRNEVWFASGQPLRVGPVDVHWKTTTNTSFRLTSVTHTLEPSEQITQSFKIFAGPKAPDLLAQYGLGDLVYYGWFWWVAVPMLWLLHAFYAVVGNYGIAIVLLTVVVRSAMFPLSRKQALGAQKMQQLQPEIKRLHEKYKNNLEARTKAQQELFKKHNYNPASGCLVVFLQLPIFVGLYNSLRVDVELRQAPLIAETIRWCSNLAAPDMLFDWSGFMPEFVSRGQGFLGLGPYFNLLPVLTVALFLWQQKMFMPPPTDEQTAVQQKVMQFMMIFIGIMFFKVASGLCVYFIASSLWSLAERQFLPKPVRAASDAAGGPPAAKPASPLPTARANPERDGAARKRKRSRKKS